MKIQIDTNEETIAVEQDVKISEFLKALKKLFPNGEWKNYTIKTETIIHWTNPIVYDRWPYPYYPWRQPWEPWTTWDGTLEVNPTDTITTYGNSDRVDISHQDVNPGVYQIEIN